MDEIIELIQRNSVQVTCSVMTLTEILPMPIKSGDINLIKEYRSILLYSREFYVLPISQMIAETAAQLRAIYNLKTPDALHIATAIESKCDAFLTNDIGLKRISAIQILVLDELTL